MNIQTEQLIRRFKALADPIRLRLITLCSQGECSVSELTHVLSQSQPRVSQHLKTLCDAGLLERFRDGHFVFYRLPADGSRARHRLLDLIFVNDPVFEEDASRLRTLRGSAAQETPTEQDRALHRALVELTVSAPLGDLLDVGCGQGRLLKLLASRARRAVGVDIDARARRFARAELLLAGLPNCTLRKGDMYALPFSRREFDTVVLDDVLNDADRPADAIEEAARLLRPGGRLLLLLSTSEATAGRSGARLAGWCRNSGLRLSVPRVVPAREPRWLLAVATLAETGSAAA